MYRITVQSRVVGSTKSDTTMSDVILDLLDEQLSVSELIGLTVEEQIRDLLLNRKLDAEKAKQALNRQYLTNADVERQAASGAIRFPSSKETHPATINIQSEIDHALQAFEKKAYLIVIDGYQPERLDEQVTLRAGSKVNFIRLTPLVGG